MTELKACPFCGSDNLTGISAVHEGGEIDTISCENCGALGGTGETTAEAIKLWNGRTKERHRK